MMKKTLCALALAAASLSAHAGITEGFEDVSKLASKGFIIRNDSTPKGPTDYAQGFGIDSGVSAQAGSAQSYLAFDYNAAAPGGTLNDWLITPLFPTFKDGSVSFYVLGAPDAGYSDQFQYGLSAGGTALADFNLSPVLTAAQGVWTMFNINFVGTGVAGSVGRLGIRYTGASDTSSGLGIDSVTVVPEPTSALLIGLGLAGLIAARRNKSA